MLSLVDEMTRLHRRAQLLKTKRNKTETAAQGKKKLLRSYNTVIQFKSTHALLSESVRHWTVEFGPTMTL
jgi:hypothetical protein